jgi:hypothetical protein
VAPPAPAALPWQDELKADIPLLGHRNWIVVTDMAYPLQSQAGIKTIYTGESYGATLAEVFQQISKAPHIRPLVYQDKELSFLSDADVKGIDALKSQMKAILGDAVKQLPHDELIARLSQVSKEFNVVILKTNLTLPYTSTFFELDCAYWAAEGETNLRARINSSN